jgi:predicted nucleic acid-binding protein
MSHLLDVNFPLACGWSSHARHADARAWLEAQTRLPPVLSPNLALSV